MSAQPGEAQTDSPTSAPSRPKTNSIRDVDFKNFTYEIECNTIHSAPLVDGHLETPGIGNGAVSLGDVVYFDATGDGIDDALITVNCEVGVSGFAASTFVYTVRSGVATKAGDLNGYDPKPGVAPGTVMVDSPEFVASEPRCCPTHNRRTTYRYVNGRFVEIAHTLVKSAS